MAKKRSSPLPYMLYGYVIIFIAFGVAGVWAATAPLDSAVVTHGSVVLEGNRKSIQHLEGGIVEEILVKEAERVEKGDVLLRLSDVQARSNADVLSTRLMIARATEARLVAETLLEDKISFPDEVLDNSTPDIVSAVEGQRDIFNNRMSLKNSQEEILQNRVDQLNRQIDGLRIQEEAYSDRIKIQSEQLDRLRSGTESGVVQFNYVAEKEDAVVQVKASLGSVKAEIAKTQAAIGETKLQLLQVGQQFVERASSEMKDNRTQINELQERLKVAEDVLARTEVRSPVTGTVQNVRVHTTGGVIAPGSLLMEVVPDNEELVINARVSPIDIDNVRPGLSAEVRFVAFNSRYVPLLFGTVETVSRDVIVNDSQQNPYFLARINVDENTIPDNIKDRLAAGMPADVIIETGGRTVAEYLIGPLENAIRKSFREE